MLPHGLIYAYLSHRDAESTHQRHGIVVSAICSPEPRHGDAYDARARQIEHIKRPARHKKRQRRIQSARDAYHKRSASRGAQALTQSAHLYVDYLLTALGEGCIARRHKRILSYLAQNTLMRATGRYARADSDYAIRRQITASRTVSERAQMPAIMAQGRYIYVSDCNLRLHLPSLVCSHDGAILCYDSLAVKSQICR